MNKFGRIGVLMGGPSSEREISLRSGNAALKALQEAGHDAVAIDAVGEVEGKIRQADIDVAFIALHGKFGEDGGIQTILERMAVPYTGSGPKASANALDKEVSTKLFEKQNIRVPKHSVLRKKDYLGSVFVGFNLEFPLVIKPACEGSSIGLSIIDSPESLDDAINTAFKYDDKIIVEEFVQGRELTVGILEDKPLPIVEIRPKNKFYDYQAKYIDNNSKLQIPAKLSKTLSEQIQDYAIEAVNILKIVFLDIFQIPKLLIYQLIGNKRYPMLPLISDTYL